jgi:hypothetical protein
LILGDEFFGKAGGAGTGFDSGVDMGAEGGDKLEDGVWIVGDGLIGKDVSLSVHDTDLDDVLVVVNADENRQIKHFRVP